jgi:hypothetical protein
MRKTILIFTSIVILSVVACDKPDALKQEAFLVVENNSSSYNITGVYYSNSGYGSNRISSNIGPGGSKTFTLNAEDNYIYDFKITSDNPDALEYTNEEVHFYDDRRITITLMNDYWDTDYPW